MNLFASKTKITVVGGRPGSGKSKIAYRYAEFFIRKCKRVIYCHAEGPGDLHESDFEFLGPSDIDFLDYIPDIFTTKEDLLLRMNFLGHEESLVVIDTVDLFDCEPHDLIESLRRRIKGMPVKVLLLANLPRQFESKPKDFAEEFLRRKYALADEEITVLGNFPFELAARI